MRLRHGAMGLALAAAIPAAASGRAAPSTTPREIHLVLAPHAATGQVDRIDGQMTISAPDLKPGETLVAMGLTVASIPTARYDGDALRARDAAGDLALTAVDGKPGPFGTERRWLASRATRGDVVLRFSAAPRHVDAHTRPGPLFDLRAEGAGAHGAGVSFLPLPKDGDFAIDLKWDLSAMPPGTWAVSSHGEGAVKFKGAPQQLSNAFYAVGPLHAAPARAAERAHFGIYWLTPPPFSMESVSGMIERLYAYESAFFQDQGGAFRVFARRQPYLSGGGTAAGRSFMFGWNENYPQSESDLQDLLAHEMSHTWPLLDGDHADTAWYSEGNAEYYSILSSWRAGIISDEQFLGRVNQRVHAWSVNPRQGLSNHEAEAIYWQDPHASRVPYGRGFVYLARVDALLRQRSGGKRSLDNIVVELSKRKQAGKPAGIPEWLALVEAELGPGARTEYEAMAAGRAIVLPDGGFGPCFKLERVDARLYDLGFDPGSLEGTRKVIRGLAQGSNAARAGLHEGDVVVNSTPTDWGRTIDMVVTVERDGKPLAIAYRAEGALSPSYRWAWRKERPAGSCILPPTVPVS